MGVSGNTFRKLENDPQTTHKHKSRLICPSRSVCNKSTCPISPRRTTYKDSMSFFRAKLPCARTGRLCTRIAVLFGLLNAALMLIVPSVKINEQAKVKAAAAGGRCSTADTSNFAKCTRKLQSDNIRNPSHDLCSFSRRMAGCIPVCLCQMDYGRELMIDLQTIVDRATASGCPLTCGDRSWLPNSSAATLILFGVFGLPFEGAAALAAFRAECCTPQNCLDRVSPTWARCLVCLLEAAVLVSLQIHHHSSVTGWAFSAMCCVSGILYAIAVCDPEPTPVSEIPTIERDPVLSEAGAAHASATGAAAATRPALEESKSTVATSRVSARPPQMEEALRNGII